jgi:hypothetical protein
MQQYTINIDPVKFNIYNLSCNLSVTITVIVKRELQQNLIQLSSTNLVTNWKGRDHLRDLEVD